MRACDSERAGEEKQSKAKHTYLKRVLWNLAVVGLLPQLGAVLGGEETKYFFLHALGGDAPVEIQLIDGRAIADTHSGGGGRLRSRETNTKIPTTIKEYQQQFKAAAEF